MHSSFHVKMRALAVSLVITLPLVSFVFFPQDVRAALVAPFIPAAPLAEPEMLAALAIDDDDDEEEVSYSSRRGGYSSSLRRKINALDDDEVKKLPIPVLFVPLSKITSDFGDPRGGGTREHEGQDILAPRGSYIVSPTEAVVTRTGKGGSAGVYVYTANPGGETFRYMHLDRIADGVKEGTVLEPGDLIGYVGNTGNASGGPHHLHFEIRDGRKALDPYPRLTGSFSLKEQISILQTIIKILTEELKDAR